MQTLTPGHKYVLENFEMSTPSNNTVVGGQTIQFIEKVPDTNPANPLVTVNNGTTNEEVLKVLIDRLQFLGAKLPSRENSLALTKCEEALMWLERRTANRKNRGVEGTHQA